MDNYYDHTTGEWVTDWTRYEAVLAEPRFSSIRDNAFQSWPADRVWDLLIALLHAVPRDTVHHVGAGPLENLIYSRGTELIDRLESDLLGDQRLQAAIIEVNLARGTLPPAIGARLVAAAGPKFSLREPDSG
jgi:hypothetical protein